MGFGLAGVSLLAGGWTRLVSPLTWQSGRGLQIESIWAVPLMVARAVRPDGWTVDMSPYQAYEIFGPGVGFWVQVSNVATLVGLVALAALFVRAFRAGGSTPVAVGFLILTTVALMIVTNKTLSPQYLLWLGGPAAALLLIRDRARTEERIAIRRTAYALVLLALLTHLVYPLLYDGLLGRWGHPMVVLATGRDRRPQPCPAGFHRLRRPAGLAILGCWTPGPHHMIKKTARERGPLRFRPDNPG